MHKGHDNIIRLYDVKPELALEHLNRSTGLEFDRMPQNLAQLVVQDKNLMKGFTGSEQNEPPILTDVVALP